MEPKDSVLTGSMELSFSVWGLFRLPAVRFPGNLLLATVFSGRHGFFKG